MARRHTTWIDTAKKCERCGNILVGFQQRGDICNACLDAPKLTPNCNCFRDDCDQIHACEVCREGIQGVTHNVCALCSDRLRRGETIKAPRVYCMPNCVHTYILAKLVKGQLQMQFTDEPGTWHTWYTALAPRKEEAAA